MIFSNWLKAELLIIVAFIIFLPAINGNFLWDDDELIKDNLDLRSSGGLVNIWADPINSTGKVYWPMTLTSFWFEYQLWGEKTFGYHLTNIVLHILNSLLLWRICTRVNLPGAYLCALLFAFHPVHVESVAWMTERKDVLSGFFYLLAFWYYLNFDQTKKKASWLISLVFYMCTLLSKPVSVTLPVSILILVWYQRKKFTIKSDILPLLPFFLTGGAFALAIIGWMGQSLSGMQALGFPERLLLSGQTLWYYAFKIFWPWPLLAITPQWKIHTGQWWQYVLPTLALLMIVQVLLNIRRWGKGPAAVILFFFLTLSPLIGTVNSPLFEYSWVADRFLYLPIIGPLMGISFLWSRWAGQAKGPSFRPAVIAAAVVCSVLAGLSFYNCRFYNSNELLFRHNLGYAPNNWRVRDCYGLVLLKNGKHREAIRELKKSLELNPGRFRTHNNLAIAYKEAGILDKAVAQFTQTLRINPDYVLAYYNLALTQEALGDMDAAMHNFFQAMDRKPGWSLPVINLARIFAAHPDERYRDGKQALKLAEEANRIEKYENPFFLVVLAAAYGENRRFDKALLLLDQAETLAKQKGMKKLSERIGQHRSLYRSGKPVRFEKL